MIRVDEWGRTIVDAEDIQDILYAGGSIDDIFVEISDEISKFNELCRFYDKTEFSLNSPPQLDYSPDVEHKKRQNTWLIANELRDLDVREFLLSLCDNKEQCDRINEEMNLYEDRGLVQLLVTMIFLVDYFRQNNIVYGVGRGSSVASYVLYKIGVHRIDSLKYGLNISEFLKD